jgi:membrane protein YqaA with SNARE-associated domain
MPFNELIWFIFSDEIVAAMLVPIHHKYALKAALIYHGHNSIILYITAFLGSLIGSSINFILAKIIKNGLNLKIKLKTKQIDYCKFLLLLIIIEILGSAISFLVAMTNIKFKTYITITTIAYLIYYSYRVVIN